MPTIPALTLASATEVDIEEVYDGRGTGGLFTPRAVPDTGEILHGGLDEANYAGGTNSIEAESFQLGSFGRGWYYGFDRFEFQYSRQLSGDGAAPGATFQGTDEDRIIHAGLSTRVFVPWDSLILYGYQAFLQHDATRFENSGGTPNTEFWGVRVRVVNLVNTALFQRLAHTRGSSGTASGGPDPTESSEERWKWVSKQSGLEFAKGYAQIQVSVWGRVFAPDSYKAKIATPTGGVWILALRKPTGT